MKKLLLILSVVLCVGIVFTLSQCNSKYQDEAVRVSDVLNTVYNSMIPHSTSKIEIKLFNNDSIVYLPAYEDLGDIRNKISNLKLSSKLCDISKDDKFCPALIWIKDDQIVSGQRLLLTVDTDLSFNMWNGKEQTVITITKDEDGYLRFYIDSNK